MLIWSADADRKLRRGRPVDSRINVKLVSMFMLCLCMANSTWKYITKNTRLFNQFDVIKYAESNFRLNQAHGICIKLVYG